MANIFMFHFQEKWVLNNNARPSVWFQYVDDTFTLFDNKNSATQFLYYFSNCHANIKFTLEFEEKSTIPFLDILIKRHNHTLILNICLPKEDLYRPVHKMGLLHTLQIQTKPHPHTHFSLFPHLFITFSFAIFSE